ncbi:MAG: hypothetical protein MUF02_05105 [Acidobacteria bacterium]|jgi:Tfp pilus assembly protein PilO|nr:hypothetical protein [Acidobacteriota bacterium]
MKNYRTVVIVLLALFGLGAAACLFSLAYASARSQSRRQLLESRAAYQAQVKDLQALRLEHGEWRRLPDELRRFRREQIFSMEQYAAFRRELNQCLEDNGFPPPTISLQFGAGSGRTRRVSLRFALSGSYGSLKKFIFTMEQKPRMHFFELIELTGSGDKVQGQFAMEVHLEE